MRAKRPVIANIILKKKITKLENQYQPTSRITVKARVIKTVVFGGKRQINHWTIIESPEIEPHKYYQLIFLQRSKGNTIKKLVPELDIHMSKEYIDADFTPTEIHQRPMCKSKTCITPRR